MPLAKLITPGLPIALGLVMLGAGVANVIGPSSIRESFARWGYPPRFSSVDGRARIDGRSAAADPGDRAPRRDSQPRDPAGCGDDPHPLSRLDTLSGRRRADSCGSSGGYDSRIAAATVRSTGPSSFAWPKFHIIVPTIGRWRTFKRTSRPQNQAARK